MTYPADFMLVATKNPCPCGYYGDPEHQCICSPGALSAYATRISGPLLDRIDLIVSVTRVPHERLMSESSTNHDTHIALQQAVERARNAQSTRYGASRTNASLASNELVAAAKLSTEARALLLMAAKKLDLSARSYFKVLRVARSIADLDGIETVETSHISEALQYRMPG